jgi:putative peptidoglycan lipid II flippase
MFIIMNYLMHWKQWLNKTTNRRIFSATITIAALSLIAKMVSTAKEIVVARSFGTGDAIDAFLIAILVPSYAISVIGGSFNAALIPTYIRIREQEGIIPAQKLFSSTMAGSLILLSLATISMVVAAPFFLPCIASGFSPDKIALTCRLLYFLSPMVILYGMNTLWGAVLNADRRFGLVAITPVITPLVVLLFVLFGSKMWGVSLLAIGTVCGVVLEVTLIGAVLKRKGLLLWPQWHGLDSNMRQVIKQFVPMIAGAFLMCGTGFVDQSMAAMLGPGSVAALSYGNKIISVLLALSATALGTAVIPYFSTMAAQHDWSGVRHTLKRYLLLIFVTTVPATFILISASEPLVRLLYQRGSFTAGDTQLVAQVQSLCALQIPFYIAGILMVRLISSMLASYVLMIGNFINLAVCISLNYIFMRKFGVAGIALSTSCVYLVSFLFLYFSWRRISSR